MRVTGVKLTRQGNDAVVLIEVHGRWIEIIHEPFDACFDHIVNESGIRKAVGDAANEQSYDDLRASGGIVDAP